MALGPGFKEFPLKKNGGVFKALAVLRRSGEIGSRLFMESPHRSQKSKLEMTPERETAYDKKEGRER